MIGDKCELRFIPQLACFASGVTVTRAALGEKSLWKACFNCLFPLPHQPSRSPRVEEDLSPVGPFNTQLPHGPAVLSHLMVVM